MKGMIFTEFLDMAEERYGLAAVERILERARPANQGAYTSVGNYHHAEMIRLVDALAQECGTAPGELLDVFGRWVFLRLFVAHYGAFFSEPETVFEFLSGIESYIHVEVRKLYPDAELPTFEVSRPQPGILVMIYRSQRPFAHFAHGLIRGCIEHYGETIQVAMEELSAGAGTAARFTLTHRDAAT